MSLSKITKTTEAETETEVEAQPATTTAITIPGLSNGAMSAAVEDSENPEGGFEFPVLTLSDEGKLEPADFMPEEAADQLVHWLRGKAVGVVLGYRVDVLSWPRGYDPDREETDKPHFYAAVPMTERDDANLIADAAKGRQFTARDLQSKWDVEEGGPGHIKPNLTLVVWDPAISDVVLLQGHLNYNGFAESREALKRALKTSGGGAFACQVQAKAKKIKSWSSGHFGFDFSVRLDSSDQKAFEQWIADADKSDLDRWLGGADRPMTSEVRDQLKAAVDLYDNTIKPEMDSRRNR